MTAKKPEIDLELLSELARGADKIFENAVALFEEAKILAANGAPCRALFLHQISLEECAKIDSMGAWVASLLSGLPVDGKKVWGALTRHSNKNRINAYMLEASPQEIAARQRGDQKIAAAEFKKLQKDHDVKSNIAKNASLYVDFKDGKFVAPLDQITDEMVIEIAVRNERFLDLMAPMTKIIFKWARDPEDVQDTMVEFVRKAEAVRKNMPDDFMGSFNKLMNDFSEIWSAKQAAKSGQDER